jgi:hypothetical protein
VYGIVIKEVSQGPRPACRIIDLHDLQVVLAPQRARGQATHPTETVDAYSGCHVACLKISAESDLAERGMVLQIC